MTGRTVLNLLRGCQAKVRTDMYGRSRLLLNPALRFRAVAVQKEPSERSSPLMGAGSVLQLIRDREGMTRSDLARITGLARSTVAQRVDALLAHELVYEAGGTASTGGRPPAPLALYTPAGGGPLARPPGPPPP